MRHREAPPCAPRHPVLPHDVPVSQSPAHLLPTDQAAPLRPSLQEVLAVLFPKRLGARRGQVLLKGADMTCLRNTCMCRDRPPSPPAPQGLTLAPTPELPRCSPQSNFSRLQFSLSLLLVTCLCFISRPCPAHRKALRTAQSAQIHFAQRFQKLSHKHCFSQGCVPGPLPPQAPWSSSTSATLTLKIIASYFANRPSVWVCLVRPHG